MKARRRSRLHSLHNESDGQESSINIGIPEQINSRKGLISRMDVKSDDEVDSASSSEKLKSESEDFFSCESSEESYDLIEARTKLIKAKYNELLDNTVVTENAEEENMEFSRTK